MDLYRYATTELGAEKYVAGLNLEGKLTGVPDCCSQNFAQLRQGNITQKNPPPETITKNQLAERIRSYGIDPNDVEKAGTHLFSQPYLKSFWAHQVFPCSIDCQEAQGRGNDILRSLEAEPKLQRMYRGNIMLYNALNALGHIPRMSGKMWAYEHQTQVAMGFLGLPEKGR